MTFSLSIKKISAALRGYVRILNPVPPIGGLAITDTSLRFLLIRERENDFVLASLRLAPGIVSGGEIKDPDSFKAALRALHAQIVPIPAKPVLVVLLLPAGSVYLQSFSVPDVGERKLDETARLNMQMLSPIDLKGAYFGWHKIGESTDTNQIDLLGAFAESEKVDAFTKTFEESGFVIAAIEFPALALTRAFIQFAPKEIAAEGRLLIDVSPEGFAAMVIKNRNLYFNEFHSWKAIQEEMAVKSLGKEETVLFLTREIERILNFYATRFGGTPVEAVLVAEHLRDEIEAILKKSGIKIGRFAFEAIAELDPVWFPALGAAYRGIIPRALDTMLSLTGSGVQARYFEERVMHFIGLWRKIALGVAGLILVFSVGVDSFLARTLHTLTTYEGVTATPEQRGEITRIQGIAAAFNRSVAFGKAAAGEIRDWTPYLLRLRDLAGTEVELQQFVLDSENKGEVSGSASNELTAIAFKNRLIQESMFKDVVLPLANIQKNVDGSVKFKIQLSLTASR